MIVFAIAFGLDHLRKLFQRAMPSLLTPGNLPAVAHEEPELFICTRESDVPHALALINESGVTSVFGKRISAGTAPPELESFDANNPDPAIAAHRARSLTHYFLCNAAAQCVKKGRSFIHVSPDFLYADGTIQTCWALHRLTGKVVSTFNGRVSLDETDRRAKDVLAKALSRPYGVQELFGERMIDQWRMWSTDDPDNIPGNVSGSLLFKQDGKTFIFSGAPNPLVGKFTDGDLVYFAATRFSVWDHEWQDRLFDTQRLLIQTNLDLGMTIEIESTQRDAGRNLVTSSHDAYSKDMEDVCRERAGLADLREARRSHRFSDKYSHFCFTTTRPTR